MSNTRDITTSSRRLFWVGVIALVASVLTTWLRTESVQATLVFGSAAAVISVAIVWFVDWTRGRR
ncbi:MAG TPA: hypothetical protein VFM03_04465 [Candidatus Limnocylindria bacterium]|nr:hypothetical protein [Candidatus Limnocylindria bacterium]